MAEPHDDYETKARALRALFRKHKPSHTITPRNHLILNQAEQDRQREIVLAEYQRLFGRTSWDLDLSRILKSVWTEELEMAGKWYDYGSQCWRNPDGSRYWAPFSVVPIQ